MMLYTEKCASLKWIWWRRHIYFLHRTVQSVSVDIRGICPFHTLHQEDEVKSLPPKSTDLSLPVMRAHMQLMLSKAADQQTPPDGSADIIQFNRDILDSATALVFIQADLCLSYIQDLMRYECKKCSIKVCATTKNIFHARHTATTKAKTAVQCIHQH